MARWQDIPRPPWKERLRVSFAHTGRTVALVWRTSPLGMVALVALTILTAALYPASAYVGKLIIDAVVAAQGAANGPLDRVLRCVLLELGVISAIALSERA